MKTCKKLLLSIILCTMILTGTLVAVVPSTANAVVVTVPNASSTSTTKTTTTKTTTTKKGYVNVKKSVTLRKTASTKVKQDISKKSILQ